ncbi:MAG: hypothetical protein QM778_17885 [Myxococcales bacterium]
MRASISWLLWGWFCLAPSVASASFGLHWVRMQGAEACIDPHSLARRVEALIGGTLGSPAEAETAIEGVITREGEHYRVRLTLSRAGGPPSQERVLVSAGADCRALDATVAFVIALTIDPSASLQGLPPELAAEFAQERPPEETLLDELSASPTTPPEADSAPAAETSAGTSPATSPARSPAPVQAAPVAPPRSLVVVGAAVLGGTLPTAMPGLGIAFGVNVQRYLSLLGDGQLFLSTSEHALEGGTATTRAYQLGVALCPSLPLSRMRLRACVGPLLTRLEASGKGFDVNHRADIWEVDLRFGLGANVVIARGWGVFLELDGRARFSDKPFVVAEPLGEKQAVLAPERFGVMGLLGPSYEF